MDELAHTVEMDPLEFRLKNLKEERLRAVFQQRHRRHDHSRSAVAALQRADIEKRLLHRMQKIAVRKPLYGAALIH